MGRNHYDGLQGDAKDVDPQALIDWLGPSDPKCNACHGLGWVCRCHTREPYSDSFGCQVCTLGGSDGIPCPICRPHCHLHDNFVGRLKAGEA